MLYVHRAPQLERNGRWFQNPVLSSKGEDYTFDPNATSSAAILVIPAVEPFFTVWCIRLFHLVFNVPASWQSRIETSFSHCSLYTHLESTHLFCGIVGDCSQLTPSQEWGCTICRKRSAWNCKNCCRHSTATTVDPLGHCWCNQQPVNSQMDAFSLYQLPNILRSYPPACRHSFALYRPPPSLDVRRISLSLFLQVRVVCWWRSNVMSRRC